MRNRAGRRRRPRDRLVRAPPGRRSPAATGRRQPAPAHPGDRLRLGRASRRLRRDVDPAGARRRRTRRPGLGDRGRRPALGPAAPRRAAAPLRRDHVVDRRGPAEPLRHRRVCRRRRRWPGCAASRSSSSPCSATATTRPTSWDAAWPRRWWRPGRPPATGRTAESAATPAHRWCTSARSPASTAGHRRRRPARAGRRVLVLFGSARRDVSAPTPRRAAREPPPAGGGPTGSRRPRPRAAAEGAPATTATTCGTALSCTAPTWSSCTAATTPSPRSRRPGGRPSSSRRTGPSPSRPPGLELSRRRGRPRRSTAGRPPPDWPGLLDRAQRRRRHGPWARWSPGDGARRAAAFLDAPPVSAAAPRRPSLAWRRCGRPARPPARSAPRVAPQRLVAPAWHVVVAMGDEEVAPSSHGRPRRPGTPHASPSTFRGRRGELPLARARNAAAARAALEPRRRAAGLPRRRLHPLPRPCRRYERAAGDVRRPHPGTVAPWSCGAVAYLPAGPGRAATVARLRGPARPHPARPAPPPDESSGRRRPAAVLVAVLRRHGARLGTRSAASTRTTSATAARTPTSASGSAAAAGAALGGRRRRRPPAPPRAGPADAPPRGDRPQRHLSSTAAGGGCPMTGWLDASGPRWAWPTSTPARARGAPARRQRGVDLGLVAVDHRLVRQVPDGVPAHQGAVQALDLRDRGGQPGDAAGLDQPAGARGRCSTSGMPPRANVTTGCRQAAPRPPPARTARPTAGSPARRRPGPPLGPGAPAQATVAQVHLAGPRCGSIASAK